MHLSPDQVVGAPALAGDIALCSWATHLTLTLSLSPPGCINVWVTAKLMLGITLQWTTILDRTVETVLYNVVTVHDTTMSSKQTNSPPSPAPIQCCLSLKTNAYNSCVTQDNIARGEGGEVLSI